jgi:hypothetical protein
MANNTGHGGARPGSGRPKGAMSKYKRAMVRKARKYSMEMLDTLYEVGKSSESDSARITAANSILDRAFGKPVQQNEHSGPDGGPIKTENKTWREILRDEGVKQAEEDQTEEDRDNNDED